MVLCAEANRMNTLRQHPFAGRATWDQFPSAPVIPLTEPLSVELCF